MGLAPSLFNMPRIFNELEILRLDKGSSRTLITTAGSLSPYKA